MVKQEIQTQETSGSQAKMPRVCQADIRDVLEQMYQNQYFTNHGPLAQKFERELETFLKIENVVTVGNESLALLIALSGCDVQGQIVTSALGGQVVAQVAAWLQLEVNFCDVDSNSGQPGVEQLDRMLDDSVGAVVLIESWGNRCDPRTIQYLVESDRKVIVVAFDSLGALANKRYVNDHPDVVTVFSFGRGKILETLQGGAIATNVERLAHRFRNVRSSYGVRQSLEVLATCNGRFSEFQAGMGIKSLSYLIDMKERNQMIARCYNEQLQGLGQLEFFDFPQTDGPSYQCLPAFLDFPERQLVKELLELGVRFPHEFENGPGQVTESLTKRVCFLPMTGLGENEASQIAESIRQLVGN